MRTHLAHLSIYTVVYLGLTLVRFNTTDLCFILVLTVPISYDQFYVFLGRKRSFDTTESKEVEEKDVSEPAPPPPKRKITVRSSRQEGEKETNRSSTYKRLEIVHVSYTHVVLF